MPDALPFGGPRAARGTVHLVGGGPGDPGLIGLRAAQLLATADVVAYDRLAPPQALELCRVGARLVDVGKQPDRHPLSPAGGAADRPGGELLRPEDAAGRALSQEGINALLVTEARRGQAVVRLKGGDPFVFGRGSEEAQACRSAGVPFEVVPGVTSAVAAPAYAGIPVTHRGLAPAFAVVTGHEDPGKPEAQVDLEALARFPGTLVLLMGVGRLGGIADALVAHGKPATTPAAVVRWGSTPRQEVVSGTLGTIAAEVAARGLGPPAVTVIGDVAALRDEVAWFDQRPLSGVRVLVPRTRHQASALSERLRALGADPVQAPTIAITPTREPGLLRGALVRVRDGAYDWIGLTSANGVEAVWRALADLRGDARWLAASAVAAVGPGTAEALAARGISADLVPQRFTTAGLADALTGTGTPARILLPSADLATPALTAALRSAGWTVDEVEAYRTALPSALPDGVAEDLATGGIDVIAFASSSTVTNLVTLLRGVPDARVRIASIGPVTSTTCRELGLRVDAEADPHDLDGLVAAVRAAVGR